MCLTTLTKIKEIRAIALIMKIKLVGEIFPKIWKSDILISDMLKYICCLFLVPVEYREQCTQKLCKVRVGQFY